MKKHAFAMSLLALIVALIASGAQAANESAAAASASDCERADTIRKQVSAAQDMPREIKEELLHKAATLCPEKGDAAALLTEADSLYAQKKTSEALEKVQKAVELNPGVACPKAFAIARDLVRKQKAGVARVFYETGLSACPDETALGEYDKLVQAQTGKFEEKGPKELIGKDVIVESLERSGPPPEERTSRSRRRPHRETYDEDYEAPRVVFHSILFESGSAELTPSSKEQLDELGQALSSQRLRHVRGFYINGYTDSIGTEERNCDLGYQRAQSVIRYLVQKWDLRPSRLVPQSFGQNKPIATNATPVGRFLNRRVEVRNGDAGGADDYYMSGRCR
jgi:outer membrane protein OmpA-like peptidoglycan-associated protein